MPASNETHDRAARHRQSPLCAAAHGGGARGGGRSVDVAVAARFPVERTRQPPIVHAGVVHNVLLRLQNRVRGPKRLCVACHRTGTPHGWPGHAIARRREEEGGAAGVALHARPRGYMRGGARTILPPSQLSQTVSLHPRPHTVHWGYLRGIPVLLSLVRHVVRTILPPGHTPTVHTQQRTSRVRASASGGH